MSSSLKQTTPAGFSDPTALPGSREQADSWQRLNRSWWERNPMRYDWRQKIDAPEFTAEFYREIDRRFFSDARTYMPWKERPFDRLIDFESLRDKDVLEIGVGNGSHAQLLASVARSFTGIDLTDYAVESTSKRMSLFGIPATIVRMDAENLQFADNTFDFVWSWGVIHHSSDTRKVLSQIHRVLRPGGAATVMVYYRNWWNYYFISGFLHGIVRGELLRTKSVHSIMQHWADGALARFYTIPEWKTLVSGLFRVREIHIFGGKAELFAIPSGGFKTFVMNMTPDVVSRAFLNHCRMGSLLVSTLRKKN
jgi:ubiquinone/menaquinone biosynthesis C-methylase UbiE